MARKEIQSELRNIITDFTDEVTFFFDCPLDKAFLIATYILSQKELPVFDDLSKEQNATVSEYYGRLKSIDYTVSEMRRAFSEAYLVSQKEVKNYVVNTTLELPLIYLSRLTDTIAEGIEYTSFKVLNASGNNGNLALLLSESKNIEDDSLYVTVETDEQLSISSSLRDLSGKSYPIQNALPSMNFRCDVLVSDPFLRKVEDILIFFEDFTEYLNQGGFFICVLPTEYVRSRYYSDSLERYGLCLIGLIEYPKDILEGLIQSSIVIMEKKNGLNKEFFHMEMPSVRQIDENLSAMDAVINYIKEYLKDR